MNQCFLNDSEFIKELSNYNLVGAELPGANIF